MGLEEFGQPATGERYFGYVHSEDPRDKRYPMRLILDPLRELAFPRGIPEGTRHYKPGHILNQRSTGTCVAHGWTSKIEGAPIMQPMPMTPYDFYRKLVLFDEYRENDREANAPDSGLQYGSSVRGGAKAAQDLGLIKNYVTPESVDDVRAWHLSGRGGVVIGITWLSYMMDTDSDGFVNFKGSVEGGHCVCSTGWSDTVKHNGRIVRAIRLQQSWGLPWGDDGKGRMWMEEDDFGKALADQGECFAATEIRVRPTA